MSFKYEVMLLWSICMTFKVVTSSNGVVLVNRNVKDSFRVGKDGCSNNTNVCTRSATCQAESGLCLCKDDSPNFVNGVVESPSEFRCVRNEDMYKYFGKSTCDFAPFQLIPYSNSDLVKEVRFSTISGKRFQSCFYPIKTKAKVKFPEMATAMEIEWLNKYFVNFAVSGNNLLFKWNISVPKLQGTIIKLNLRCRRPKTDRPGLTIEHQCFQAKVQGTWLADISKPLFVPTKPSSTPTTTTPGTVPEMSQGTNTTTTATTTTTTTTGTTSVMNQDVTTTTTTTPGTTSKMLQNTTISSMTTIPGQSYSNIMTTSARSPTTSIVSAIQSLPVKTQPSNTPTASEIIAGTTTTTPPTISEVTQDTAMTTTRTKSEVTTDTTMTTTPTTSEVITDTTTTPPTTSEVITGSTIATTLITSKATIVTPHVSVTDLMKKSPPPGRPRSPQELPGSDGDFNWTLVVVAVVVPLVIVVALVFVVCFLFKRRKRKYQANSRRENVEARSDTSGEVQSINLVGNVPSNGATETVVAVRNPTYSTPEIQSVIVVVNPCYGALDVKTKEAGEASSSDPAYDTPGGRKEEDKCQSDPGYESIVVVKEGNEIVDDKKEEMNGGDPKTDISGDYIDIKKANTKKDEKKEPSPDSDPDEKMKVNVKVDGANLYGEPGYESPDVQKDEIEGASSESAYAKPDKKRETNDGKVKDSIDPDSYEEPGYETPDIAKEETDGTRPDATYAKPDRKRSEENIKHGQSTAPDFLEEPGYATPDLKMEDTKGSSSDATYAKPDKKRLEGNIKSGQSTVPDFLEEPGYATPDLKMEDTKGSSSDATYAKPDKKRLEGNIKSGQSTVPDFLEEPGYAIPDLKMEDTKGSSADATYAKPDKKRLEGNIKSGQSTVPDSLEEPGYATPYIKMEDTKGSSADTTYAKPDKKRSEGNIKSGGNIVSDSYEEPGYEILKKDDTVGTTSDTTYAKPDKKKKEVERQNHPGSDNSTKNDEKIASNFSPDIKRIEINGDLYALPDKSKNSEKVDGSNKEENPPKLVSDPEDANESQDESSKPTAEPKTEK